jgi:hypothetical protein
MLVNRHWTASLKKALTLNYNGRQDKGRPRKCWIDGRADTTANIIQQTHYEALSWFLHLHSVRHLEKEKKKVLITIKVLFITGIHSSKQHDYDGVTKIHLNFAAYLFKIRESLVAEMDDLWWYIPC